MNIQNPNRIRGYNLLYRENERFWKSKVDYIVHKEECLNNLKENSDNTIKVKSPYWNILGCLGLFYMLSISISIILAAIYAIFTTLRDMEFSLLSLSIIVGAIAIALIISLWILRPSSLGLYFMIKQAIHNKSHERKFNFLLSNGQFDKGRVISVNMNGNNFEIIYKCITDSGIVIRNFITSSQYASYINPDDLVLLLIANNYSIIL